MKRILLLSVALGLFLGAFSQEDKPPTQAELQQMMKQLQKEVDNLDPATKRAMDSMGIKMPDLTKTSKKLSKVSDAQIKEEWENQSRVVPKRDAARIAAMPAAVSAAGMGAYVKESQARLFARLQSAVRTVGEKLYGSYRAAGRSSAQIGNAAAALWMVGRTQTAFYLMSRVAADDPGNVDNLGNYAAMLSMLGAEQLAIPILNNLHARYPRNGTLLNNLGQAWFGLGETVRAEKYLDSSILVFGAHPQATLTKAKIQDSKGNKADATKLVKQSAKSAYSSEKEEYLRKLGSGLEDVDLRLPRPAKPDPMNLGSFTPPPFPKSVKECVVLGAQWKEFDRQLDEGISKLKKIQETDGKAHMDVAVKRVMAGQDGTPLHLAAAHKGLREAEESFNRKLKAWGERVTAFAEGKGEQLRINYEKTMAKLKKEDMEQTGEGKANEDYCPRYQKVTDEYLRAVNTENEEEYKEMLEINKIYINESAYFEMYAMFSNEYEALKPGLKGSWLTVLKQHNFRSITNYVCGDAPEIQSAGGKLSEFDDVACQYHSEMSYVVGTIKVDCSKMESTLDLGSVKLGLKQNMDKETFEDQFVSCTVAVSAGVGAKVGGAGPLEVGVGADVTGIVEIDRSGVKDVVIEGSVSVSAGSTVISDAGKSLGTGSKVAGHGVGDGSATVGLEGRISLVSGSSSGGFSFSKGGGFK